MGLWVFQLFAWFEANCLARGDGDFNAGLGISAGVRPVFFDVKGTEAADFNPFTGGKCSRHFIENEVYRCSGVILGHAVFVFQRVDKL